MVPSERRRSHFFFGFFFGFFFLFSLGGHAGNGPQLCGHSGGTVSGTQLIGQAGVHSSAPGFFGLGGRLGLTLKGAQGFFGLFGFVGLRTISSSWMPASLPVVTAEAFGVQTMLKIA
jgi:hypothetical protein